MAWPGNHKLIWETKPQMIRPACGCPLSTSDTALSLNRPYLSLCSLPRHIFLPPFPSFSFPLVSLLSVSSFPFFSFLPSSFLSFFSSFLLPSFLLSFVPSFLHPVSLPSLFPPFLSSFPSFLLTVSFSYFLAFLFLLYFIS